MIYNLSAQQLLARLPYVPTPGQELAAERFSAYLAEADPRAVFLLTGFAGTGKTAFIRALAQAVEEELGMRVELLASTGRAAQVLQAATGRTATTIHRSIYRPTTLLIEEGGAYRLGAAPAATLYVVDEASLVGLGSGERTPFGSGDLLSDLLDYVHSSADCRLVLVGDTAQLPPVGETLSPALDPEVLEQRYGLSVWGAELADVLRQAAESGILRLATELRCALAASADRSEGAELPIHLSLSGTEPDVSVLSWGEQAEVIERLYQRYGREQVLVITPSNKRALMHNQGIRQQILAYEEPLVRGEQLIVTRNNYYYAQRRDRGDFIANGEVVILKRTYRSYERYGLQFVDATIYLPERADELEVRLLLSGLTEEAPQRSYEQRLSLYEALAGDYSEAPGAGVVDVRRAIRRDPFWNALEVKYGYALTAHKAQGGQWPAVVVDLGLVDLLPRDRSMLRWLYTAVSRASEELYLLAPPPALLGGSCAS